MSAGKDKTRLFDASPKVVQLTTSLIEPEVAVLDEWAGKLQVSRPAMIRAMLRFVMDAQPSRFDTWLGAVEGQDEEKGLV